MKIKRILVPIDFSEPSKKALTYGLTLANQFGAKVIIAHILSGTDKLEETLDQEIRRDIQNLLATANVSRSPLQVIVRAGRIDVALLEIVREEGVDLVVLGTHGRRNPGRWFIGSVTEHMLRKLPVPVLTISHPERDDQPSGLVALKRILYATDRSESSNKGLQYAIELARGTGAQLTMTHVVYYVDRALWAPAGIPGFEDEQIQFSEEMRRSADEVLRQAGLSEMQIETLVVEGKPFAKILEIAEERKMDVIVLNLQSKSTFDRAFLGSTAERVVRLAHIPVLSVPLATEEQKP
jgi:nucleotide-binding universal stress UspA family protein